MLQTQQDKIASELAIKKKPHKKQVLQALADISDL